MNNSELTLNPLNAEKSDSRAHAYRNTKHLNSLMPLNALTADNGEEFKEFKESRSLRASELLANLKRDGFTFWLEADRLKWRGPTGVLTDTDRAAIRDLKPELLAHLTGATYQREYSSPADPQTERIRELAAGVSAEELLAAHREIKPLLKAQLSREDLHELALTMATAAKSAAEIYHTGPARIFDASAAYENHQAAKEKTANAKHD